MEAAVILLRTFRLTLRHARAKGQEDSNPTRRIQPHLTRFWHRSLLATSCP